MSAVGTALAISFAGLSIGSCAGRASSPVGQSDGFGQQEAQVVQRLITTEDELRSAVLAADPGDVIAIGRAAIRLTSPIELNASLTIVGGPSEITLSGSGGFTILSKGIEFQGLIFEGRSEGPAISVMQGGSIALDRCEFIGLHARRGAAILARDAEVHARDTQFVQCRAYEHGGAVSLEDRSDGSFVSCRFSHNSAADAGGAVFVGGLSSVVLAATHFDDNRSTEGGAVVLYRDSSASIHGSAFTGNNASSRGGSVFVSGGSWVDVSLSTFERSSAKLDGGAIKLAESSAGTIRQSRFEANRSDSFNGGAVHAQAGSLIDVDSSLFFANTSVSHTGGAIGTWIHSRLEIRDVAFIGNAAPELFGGAIRFGRGSTGEVVSSWFMANRARIGGAVSAGQDLEQQAGPVVLADSYFWQNAASRGDAVAANGRFPIEIVVRACAVSEDQSFLYARGGHRIAVFGNRPSQQPDGCEPYDGGDGWIDDPTTDFDESSNNDYGEFDRPLSELGSSP